MLGDMIKLAINLIFQTKSGDRLKSLEKFLKKYQHIKIANFLIVNDPEIVKMLLKNKI